MSASSVIIKFDAQDNLTPELKKQIEALKQLRDKYDALDLKIKDLKADRKGILAGTIISDIEDIKRLQVEIAKLKEAYKTASRGDKTATKNALKAKQIELESKLTRTINRQTKALKNYKEQLDYTSKSLEREYLQKKKVENASRKEDITIQKLTNIKKKENAVRRSTINAIVRHLRQVETLILAYYAVGRVIDMTIKRGIDLNKTIEDGTVGIAALIAANTEGGNSAERFSAAMAISSNTMIALKKASVETAATFPQLTEVFQQAIGGALGAGQAMGKSVDEIVKHTITLSQRMTNIASSIGMPMEQVSQEIRAIMEGTITKDARIAKMLGITTKDIDEAKKSADGLFKYLEKKLEVFDVLADKMTLGRAVARFTDALDTIRMEATKPIFDDLKYEVIDVTKELKSRAKEWVQSAKDTYFEIKAYFNYYGDMISSFSDKIEEAYNMIETIVNDTLTLLEKATNSVINFLDVSNKVSTRVEGKTLEYLKNQLKEKQEELNNADSLWGELFGTSSKKSLEDDITRIKRKISLLEKEKAIQAEKGEIVVNSLSREVHGVNGLYQAYKEIDNVSSKKFNSVSEMADYITKIVEKYKEYPEILSTLSHEVEKQMTKIGNKTKLELKITALQKIKLAEEISIAKNLNIILSDQFILWKKIKTVRENPSYNNDYSKYYKNLFDKIGYSIKAYDKAVELYKKLMSKATTASEKNEIEKIFKLKIDNLNSWIKLNYKAAKEIPTIWDDISKSMSESMEHNFFDEITGKFKSFKEFMRSLFRDLASSIINPFAHQLAGGLTSSIMGMFGGGLPQITKKLTEKDAINLGLKVLGNGVYQDSSGNKIVTDTLGNVTKAYDSKGNIVSDVMTLKSIATLPSTLKTIPTAISGGFAGLQASLGANVLSPFISGSKFLTAHGFAGAGENLINFGSGFSRSLVGGTGNFSSFSAGAGSILGAGALGYGIGSIGDAILGADTHAGIGGATGAIIGSIIPGVGTLIGGLAGSVLGGLFGKTKVTGQEQGIEFLSDVSKDNIDGRDYLTTYYKKKSWFSTKKWDSTQYQDFNDTEISAIQRVIANYDYLLTQLGKSAELVVSKGKYSSVENFLNEGATKAFIKKFVSVSDDKIQAMYKEIGDKYQSSLQNIVGWDLGIEDGKFTRVPIYNKSTVDDGYNPNGVTDKFIDYVNNLELDKIYKAWEDYAKSVNKKVYEAFNEQINNYINDIRNWKVWLFERSGDSTSALKYKADYLKKDFENLAKTFNVTGLTIENFADRYQEAISKNLTPDEIQKWEALGNALKAATDAQDAYQASVDKANQAIIDNLNRLYSVYSSDLEHFTELSYQNKGDTVGLLKYKMDNLNNAVIAMENSMGISGVTVDNFVSYFKNVNSTLSEDSLKNWEQLGNLLFNASDATKEYNQAISNEISTNKRNFIEGEIEGFNIQIDKLNEVLDNTKNNISTITNISKSLDGIINKLSYSSLSGVNSLDAFYSAINKSILLADGKDYDAFSEAVSDAISKSSALFDTDNFKTLKDQQFASQVALRQFTSIKDNTRTQLDYLRGIEENTKASIDSYKELINTLQNKSDTNNYTNSNNIQIEHQKSIVAAQGGIESYLLQEATKHFNNIKAETLHATKFAKGDIKITKNDGVTTVSHSDGSSEFYYNNPSEDYLKQIYGFADGGIVTKPTLSLIGEAGYNEAVIPLKNPNDPLQTGKQTKEIVGAINTLTNIVIQQANEIRQLRKINDDHTAYLDEIAEKVA